MKKLIFKKENIALNLIFILLLFISTIISSCDKDQSYVLPPPDTSGCDVSNVSFAMDVQSVISERCQGCHSNIVQLSGVNMEGYDNIKSYAQNGKLVSSITGSMSSHFVNKNSSCDLLKIQTWIKNGCSNN